MNANTNTAPAYTFTADSITVSGKTFPASYTVSPSGAVFVFAAVEEGKPESRIKFDPMEPDYSAALAAAKKAAKKAARRKPAAAPAPAAVQDQTAAPVAPAAVQDQPAAPAAPAAVQDQPAAPAAPAAVQDQPAAPVAPVAAPAPAKKPARRKPAAAKKAAPAEKPAPAPAAVQDQPAAPAEKPAAPAVGDKSFIGSGLAGRCWSIAFSAEENRTIVKLTAAAPAAAVAAVEAAGFWAAPARGPRVYTKKLTCKAHKAAVALAAELARIDKTTAA